MNLANGLYDIYSNDALWIDVIGLYSKALLLFTTISGDDVTLLKEYLNISITEAKVIIGTNSKTIDKLMVIMKPVKEEPLKELVDGFVNKETIAKLKQLV